MDNTIIYIILVISGLVVGLPVGMMVGSTTIIQNKTTISDTNCPTCRACSPEKICSNQCPICRACPPEKICDNTCPECPKPPKFDRALSLELTYWFKNQCRIKDGAAVYQAGSADTCDQGAEYFNIEGYPKFATRPKNSIDLSTFYSQGLTIDKTPGYFTFIRFNQYGRDCFNISQYPDQKDRKRWSWKKEQCAKSTITICHL